MTTNRQWPVAVAPLGWVAMGSTLWRARGKLNAAVFVKGTFALVPDGTMTPGEPLPIERSERYPHNNPIASLEAVCEAVPVLPQVDVLLYGHAYAPRGPDGLELAAQSVARLALLRDGHAVLDKTILVKGRRMRGAAPEPFERIPMGYDRALGGIGFADNPIGVGADPSQPNLPNFVDPRAPEQRVACLGPIPPSFPARRKLLGSFGRHLLEAPVVEISDDLDWRYFQSAPEDQRLDQLRGDESLVLEGLTAGMTTLRTALPGGRALMRIYSRASGEGGTPLSMRPDLVQINTDRMVCTVVWRASVPLSSESQASDLVVAGALEMPGENLSWPDRASQVDVGPSAGVASPAPATPSCDQPPVAHRAGSTPPSSPSAVPVTDLQGTYVLSETQAAAAAAAPSAPFALPSPASPAAGEALAKTFPGAPWGKPKPTPAPPPAAAQEPETVSVDLELADDEPGEAPGQEERAVEAEAARQAEAEAARQAEAEAARQAEAEAARQAEADRFAAEQQAAREARARREAEERSKRRAAAKRLKTNMYGGFSKRG